MIPTRTPTLSGFIDNGRRPSTVVSARAGAGSTRAVILSLTRMIRLRILCGRGVGTRTQRKSSDPSDPAAKPRTEYEKQEPPKTAFYLALNSIPQISNTSHQT